MTASSDKTLACLSFQIREGRLADFESAFEQSLAPILERHGLTPSSEPGRLTPPGVFNRLFEIESVGALSDINVALSDDTTWDSALTSLKSQLEPDPSRFSDFGLSIYSATAGSGRMGKGRGRGQFSEHGGSALRWPLYEDRDGCLWCGLSQGVGRFDDGDWTVYTPDDGLVHPDVQAICQDGDGRMWFGAGERFAHGTKGGGLSCFDGETFTNFTVADGLPHDEVTGIAYLGDLGIFVTTLGGVALHDGDRIVRTFSVDDGLPSNRVLCVSDESHGFWFGTDHGASFWDGGFTNYSKDDGLASDEVHSISCDSEGRMWFFGKDSLTRFDGVNWTVVEADWLRDEPWTTGSTVDQFGEVWVATTIGLFRYDGNRWSHFDERDLPEKIVLAVLGDSGGRIWATTVAGTLLRYEGGPWVTFADQDGVAISSIGAATSITSSGDDILWIGSQGAGLSRYDGESWTAFGPEDGLIGDQVWSLLVDRQDRLWVSTFTGVTCFHGQRVDNFLPHQMVLASCEDADGSLWFGTAAGACRYDGETWTTYRTTDGLVHDRVRCILQDRGGHMWFATAAGVSRFDGRSWRSFTTRDGLAGDRVQALTEDGEGHIWVASWGDASGSAPGGGLSRFDGERWTSYTVDDGLPSNRCSAVFADRDGHIWVGTRGAGVGRYDGRSFQIIDHRDGLGGDVVWAIHQDDDGCYWFASDGGATRYTPPPTRSAPIVAIDAVIADRRHEAAAGLHLPASTSIVSFEFHGDSERTRADGLLYRYRLQGHEEKWRSSRECRVELIDVTPGEYTFQVQAVDQEMTYSETAQMQLTVRNPLQERIDELEERVRERTADLETANARLEEQNRNLIAEQALERVRTQVAAMQESADLVKVVSALREEVIDELKVPGDEVRIILIDEDEPALRVYSADWTDPVRAPFPEEVPGAHEYLTAWRERRTLYRYFTRKMVEQVLQNYAQTGASDADLEFWKVATESMIDHRLVDVPFTYGMLAMAKLGPEPFADEHVTLIERFTEVFALGYQRHLDLQAAEMRAREAELENSIEHVRAEALSMRESDDLKKVMAVTYRELRAQEIPVTGFSALMYDEESGIRGTYIATEIPPGVVPGAVEADVELFGADIAVFAMQLQREEYPASSYERWRKGEIFHEHLDSLGYQKFVRHASEVMGVEWPAPAPDAEFFAVGFPFAEGEFSAGSERAFSEADVDIIHQFAEAAIIGYQRYLDFVSLEEANRQIQEATRHKSDFLARMSHDLRTPMNAIIGYTRILLRRTKQILDERQYQNLENIQTSADNLLVLINDVLDLSRIEAGRMDVHPEQVDLEQLIRECARSIEPLLKPDVTLELQIDGTTAMHTDPDQLRRVIVNLLSNAVKFTERGTITVALQDSAGSQQLSVADTGVGISADDLPNIFEEFHQVEGNTAEPREGTGLGLAIAKRTIELLGGEISVESEVGKGTTFTLRLANLEA